MLENKTIDLSTVVDQARALDVAQKCSESYSRLFTPAINAIAEVELDYHRSAVKACAITAPKYRCYFCGGASHNRNHCPAKEATFHKCGKKDIFLRFLGRLSHL